MFSCPKCDVRALVQRTRKVPDGVRRRYYCPDPKCGHRFTTREVLSGEDGTLLRGLNELMPNARLSGPQRPAQEVEHGTK